jgi:phosphate-selective porin OprO/OprP
MLDDAAYSGAGFGDTQFSVRRADISFQRQLWRGWLFYADTQLVNRHLELKDVYVRKQTLLLRDSPDTSLLAT